MDIFSVVLGIVLAAVLIFFISRPLRRSRHVAQAESDLESLLAQRESLYVQIRELDFDHATGKITDADHTPLRARLVKEAADVLRQIDHQVEMPPADDEVEAAVAARRQRKPAASAETDLEAAIAERRQRKPASASSSSADAELEAARRKTLACPTCGNSIQAGDAFCAKCGTPLGTQVAR